VGLTLMYGIDGLLERVLGSRDPNREPTDDADDAGDYTGGYDSERPPVAHKTSPALRMGAVVVVLLLMVGLGGLITPWAHRAGGVDEMPDVLLARVFGEQQSRVIPPDYQFRGSVRYLAHSNRRIRIEGETLEVFLGIGNEQIRQHTLISKRLAWPGSGFSPIEDSTVTLTDGGPAVRRMILRKGAQSVLSYSWIEREHGVVREWLRSAAALDRSPFHRPEHMLAIRISTPLGPGGTRVDQAESRIRAAWARLEPELEEYAPTERPVP